MNDLFYRYEDHATIYDQEIMLLVFHKLRETEKGYWIIPEQYAKRDYYSKDTIERVKKWIPKKSIRRYAYPEKKRAFHNFVKRKQFQIKMNEMWISRAKSALAKARHHEECPDFLKDESELNTKQTQDKT